MSQSESVADITPVEDPQATAEETAIEYDFKRFLDSWSSVAAEDEEKCYQDEDFVTGFGQFVTQFIAFEVSLRDEKEHKSECSLTVEEIGTILTKVANAWSRFPSIRTVSSPLFSTAFYWAFDSEDKQGGKLKSPSLQAITSFLTALPATVSTSPVAPRHPEADPSVPFAKQLTVPKLFDQLHSWASGNKLNLASEALYVLGRLLHVCSEATAGVLTESVPVKLAEPISTHLSSTQPFLLVPACNAAEAVLNAASSGPFKPCRDQLLLQNEATSALSAVVTMFARTPPSVMQRRCELIPACASALSVLNKQYRSLNPQAVLNLSATVLVGVLPSDVKDAGLKELIDFCTENSLTAPLRAVSQLYGKATFFLAKTAMARHLAGAVDQLVACGLWKLGRLETFTDATCDVMSSAQSNALALIGCSWQLSPPPSPVKEGLALALMIMKERAVPLPAEEGKEATPVTVGPAAARSLGQVLQLISLRHRESVTAFDTTEPMEQSLWVLANLTPDKARVQLSRFGLQEMRACLQLRGYVVPVTETQATVEDVTVDKGANMEEKEVVQENPAKANFVEQILAYYGMALLTPGSELKVNRCQYLECPNVAKPLGSDDLVPDPIEAGAATQAKKEEESEHTTAFKKCGGCKTRSYCGASCAGQDWKRGHRSICKKIQALKVEKATVADVHKTAE